MFIFFFCRGQLRFAKRLEVPDVKLVAMCRGLKAKVDFLINNNQTLPLKQSETKNLKGVNGNFSVVDVR